ncbi:methyltransferase family protein [Pseudoduganella flava]|uniref:Methyltransferase domain-containing protein n=1 Tax=Pseudoduganella flava TaxID=871742 RepID=A0A562PWT6_9BURK|nr:class I SAM-dependent methyltransferase [Pseudoduganella flava]QGZ39934.1 methyltransferase domain-containing protein [Pseudoduganella flava]TWI48869.1 methyltransferase family protein [Pseudoduganella flava]
MKTCVVDSKHRMQGKVFLKNGVDIYRCGDCGCIMADIDFNHEQYESNEYYTMSYRTLESIDKVWGFRWRYVLDKIVKSGNVASLLDVGAGNGYFVSLAAKEFGLRATGLEISTEEIRFAEEHVGVKLVNEDVCRHKEMYDVVTSFNVLEHVADPHGFLSAVLERVKPGGLIVVTTPNPGCIHAKVKGLERWNMVCPPHHINLFSKQSLLEMLEQRGAEPLSYETLSTYISFVRDFDSSNLVLRRTFFNLLRMAGLGADHCVIARKAPAAAARH